MKIKNRRQFILGILFVIIAFLCFGVIIIDHFEIRFLISGILSILLASYNFIYALLQKGVIEEITSETDERDIYLAMKSAHATIKITNYLLYAGCLISLILYNIYKVTVFMTLGITFSVIILALLIISLIVNRYYEKNN